MAEPKNEIFDAIFPPRDAIVTHEKHADGTESWSFVSPALPDAPAPRNIEIVKGDGKPKKFKYITSISVDYEAGG